MDGRDKGKMPTNEIINYPEYNHRIRNKDVVVASPSYASSAAATGSGGLGFSNLTSSVMGAAAAAAPPGATINLHFNYYHYDQVHIHQYPSNSAAVDVPQSFPPIATTVSSSSSSVRIEEEVNNHNHSILEVHGNPPRFDLCTECDRGVDFGLAKAEAMYKAERHVDPKFQHVTYTQCKSGIQTAARMATMGMSKKRSKIIIFLFDGRETFERLKEACPDTIHLKDVGELVRNFGSVYEYHRDKISKTRYTIYIFFIKKSKVTLSKNSKDTWEKLCHWARQLPNDDDKAHEGSSLQSTTTGIMSSMAALILALI